MDIVLFLYSNLTWKRVLNIFLGSSLMVLFLANFFVRGMMDQALFTFWAVAFGLIGGGALLFKIVIFVLMVIQRIMLMHDPKFKKMLVQQIAINNHKENDTPIDMITENLFYIVKKIHPLTKPLKVKINKNMDVLTIDGTAFELNKLIPSKDQKNMERRLEIELLMNKSIKIEQLEKLLNKKIFEDWEKLSEVQEEVKEDNDEK